MALDSLNLSGTLDAFHLQCGQVIKDISLQHIPSECSLVHNVVISGMGGSALGGRVINSIERQTLRVPIVVSTEYNLPNFVNDQSLVIVTSYSGNTAETVNSLHEAQARNAQIYVIASGGKLADLASQHNLPSYIFDPKFNYSSMPRMGLGYNIVALVTLLARCQLIHPDEKLNELPGFLQSEDKHRAELDQIARNLVGKIPVIIASEHLKGSAHALKNQFNENSKTFTCLFDLPEANHHLLEGLRFPKSNSQNLAFLFIESDFYGDALKKTYPLTKQIVSKNEIPTLDWKLHGPSRLFEAMSLIQSGAYLGFALSQLNGIDPGPIPFVDWLKDQQATQR